MKHEISVGNVILRVYNKNPAVFIDQNLPAFITAVCNELQTVAQKLIIDLQAISENQLRVNLQTREIEDVKGTMSGEELVDLTRRFFYCQYQSLLMLTSLMLSIEQLLCNRANPNHLFMAAAGDKQQTQKALWKSQFTSHQFSHGLADEVHRIVSFWLTTQVFLDKNMPLEIRVIFLQLVILVVKTKDAVNKLHASGEALYDFVREAIEKIATFEEQHYRAIEEALIFLLMVSVLEQGQEMGAMIAIQCDTILWIYEKKQKLKKLIECVLCQFRKISMYEGSISTALKKRSAEGNSTVNFDSKILQDVKYGNDLLHNLQLWRVKAAQQGEGKRGFQSADCMHIEDYLNQGGSDDPLTSNIMKLKLPLLSKRST